MEQNKLLLSVRVRAFVLCVCEADWNFTGGRLLQSDKAKQARASRSGPRTSS